MSPKVCLVMSERYQNLMAWYRHHMKRDGFSFPMCFGGNHSNLYHWWQISIPSPQIRSAKHRDYFLVAFCLRDRSVFAEPLQHATASIQRKRTHCKRRSHWLDWRTSSWFLLILPWDLSVVHVGSKTCIYFCLASYFDDMVRRLSCCSSFQQRTIIRSYFYRPFAVLFFIIFRWLNYTLMWKLLLPSHNRDVCESIRSPWVFFFIDSEMSQLLKVIIALTNN